MKKRLLLILPLFVYYSCCSTSSIVEVNNDFLMDLASENYRLSGAMYLDEFNEDLSPLSYEYYINYVEQHQAPAAENLAVKIKSADEYDFLPLTDGFVITLLYINQNKIIGDDSRTALIDTVITLTSTFDSKKLNEISKIIGHLR